MQQQLPSATSDFLPMLKRAQITQTTYCASSSSTLCTLIEHSFPPSRVRETCEAVPGRPQLPSGAVFACHFTGEPIAALDLLAMATQ